MVLFNLNVFSYIIIVPDSFIKFSNLFFRPFFGGKNPSNINLSVGKPEDTSEAKTADGPGIDSILHPTFIACLTNLYAGSDIAGVPASVITAT